MRRRLPFTSLYVYALDFPYHLNSTAILISDAALLIQVQSGGAFDIDYQVVGPGDKVILEGEKERQGDFVFTANTAGDYSFCFSNKMSNTAEKSVDFEITVSQPATLD